MISVIIPVYNGGKRFPVMLDCLRRQSEYNYEVLLIDDGSTDGSEDICDCYAECDSRFRVIHQPNSGVSAARNKGLEIALGDFIVFLDADDEIPEDYLEVLLNTQRNTTADIVCCDVVIIQDGEETGRFTHEPYIFTQEKAMNLLLSRRIINSGPCAKLFSRSALHKVSFPDLEVYEDILFVRDAFMKAGKIAISNQTEYKYLQNSNSLMHRNATAPSLDVIKATENLTNYICTTPEIDAYCLYITVSHLMQYVIPITESKEKKDIEFTTLARRFLNKYRWQILLCDAFPKKEKVLFIMFGLNKRLFLHIKK